MNTICVGLPIGIWLMVFQVLSFGGLLILLIRKAQTDKELALEIKQYINQDKRSKEM